MCDMVVFVSLCFVCDSLLGLYMIVLNMFECCCRMLGRWMSSR